MNGSTNGLSRYPDISADGRYVAFTSLASDLVDNDANSGAGGPSQGEDVFVRLPRAGADAGKGERRSHYLHEIPSRQ